MYHGCTMYQVHVCTHVCTMSFFLQSVHIYMYIVPVYVLLYVPVCSIDEKEKSLSCSKFTLTFVLAIDLVTMYIVFVRCTVECVARSSTMMYSTKPCTMYIHMYYVLRCTSTVITPYLYDVRCTSYLYYVCTSTYKVQQSYYLVLCSSTCTSYYVLCTYTSYEHTCTIMYDHGAAVHSTSYEEGAPWYEYILHRTQYIVQPYYVLVLCTLYYVLRTSTSTMYMFVLM